MEMTGGYVPVNGLKLYYEIHGAGRPLVLLHGGVGASEMFAPLLPELAEQRQVVMLHLQGHGRTLDSDRPLRFESMADDVVAALQQLHLADADLLGYSLGGGVALQTAIRHPDGVRRLVLVSAPFKQQGFHAAVLADMARLGPDDARFMGQSPLSQLYPAANWPVLFGKLGELLRQPYDWSQEAAALKPPVMLVCADADSVRPAHALEFFSLLGGGRQDSGLDGSARLAILPGRSHHNILFSPGLARMISSFLDDTLAAPAG